MKRRIGARYGVRHTALGAGALLALVLVASDLEGGQAPAAPAPDPNHKVLVRLLGKGAVVAEKLRKDLVGRPAGTKVVEDLDGDGDPDVVTFIDPDKRHSASRRPMLVRVIDDDDDMPADGTPDNDSDCYVADWKADGAIDRVVDYWDLDGDGDADRMDLISRTGLWFGRRIGLTVVEDIGDDDRMWYTHDYEYSQRVTQWLTDFNGDECFTMFYYDMAAGRFVPAFEAPFAHYDTDGDGLAEVTVRLVTDRRRAAPKGGYAARQARYSYDVDNDSHWLNRRDYDFSFNLRRGGVLTKGLDQQDRLRDGSVTGAHPGWRNIRDVIEAIPWQYNFFCWDEIDNNVATFDRLERTHERWEGVGGYGGSVSYGNFSEGNKRWERDGDYSGKMELYYSPVDRRIHLRGAEQGVLNADYDFDNRIDSKITYTDMDKDGFFDTWAYDADADGKPERTYRADPRAAPMHHRDPELTRVYRTAVAEALDQNQRIIEAMKRALGNQARSEVEDWFINRRPQGFCNPEKLLWSDEATRYYQDLIREELFTRLLAAIGSGRAKLDRARLETAYSRGDLAKAAKQITVGLVEPPAEPWLTVDGVTFQKRIRVRLTNPIEQDRPSAPIVIPTQEIRRTAPDFNAACFAVAETRRRIVIRQHPSQADDLDGDRRADEIAFCLRRLAPKASEECFIYYSPEGTWRGAYRKQAHARDGIGQSIGWESEMIAFRSYFGKVGFFGKKVECLRLDNLGSYHDDANWGMDCLHVGSAPGLGGLSLWAGDRAVRACNEEKQPARCRITQRVVADGPVRATVHLGISGLKVGDADVALSVTASTYAGQCYSEHRVRLMPASAGRNAVPLLSAGIVRLPKARPLFDPKSGFLCVWGRQDDPRIGDIGLALLVSPSEIVDRKTLADSDEIRLRLPKSGRTRIAVAADWIKSRGDQRRLVAHSGPEWSKHVRRLAERIHHPVRYEILGTESRPNSGE